MATGPDVVVGDLVLLTERLDFISESSKGVENAVL